MVKTTLYLPDDLKREVAAVARRRGISEAELLRQAIRNEVTNDQRPLPRFGILPSRKGPGTSDLSTRVDEILAEGFGTD